MRRTLLLSAGCAVLAGCGGGARSATTSTTTRATATSVDPSAKLEQGVRRAIEAEHAMSVEVLRTNRVPAAPTAIAGPALAVLRRSVAERQNAGVHVRVLSERFRIVGVRLDPSYSTATAVVIEDQRVQPTNPSGQPRGKPSTAHERVHLELRRVGDSERFVVWKVTLP